MSKLGTYAPAADVKMATDPQVRFLTSLTRELHTLTAQITRQPLDTDALDAALAHLPRMTRAAASDRIGSLKGEILPTMRQTAQYTAQTVEPAATAPAPVELDHDGIYVVAGRYFRVKIGQRSRKPYALVLDTATRSWEYAPGMAAKILPEHRITAEQAAQITLSWCIRCGRDLTQADSIARHMGPVCYRKSVG